MASQSYLFRFGLACTVLSLADAPPAALLATVSFSVVLADAHAHTLIALAQHAVVLADVWRR